MQNVDPVESNNEALAAEADDAYASGDLERAAALYGEWHTSMPTHAHPLCRLGEIAIQSQDYLLAEQYYRQAAEAQPDYAWAHLGLGQCLSHQKKWPAALEHFRRAALALPDSVYVQELLDTAQCAAAEQMELVAELLARADECFDSDDLAGAESLYADLVEASGNSLAHPLCRLGELALGRGDAKAAEDHFRRAISVDDGYIWAQFGLGNALAIQGKWPEAARALAHAWALKPDAAYIADLYKQAAANELMLPVLAAFKNGSTDATRQALGNVLVIFPDFTDARAIVQQLVGTQEASAEDNLAQYRVELELNSIFNQGLAQIVAMAESARITATPS